MDHAFRTEESLREALADAGCDDAMQDRCIALMHDGMNHALLRQLETHRATLIERSHAVRERIERVDLLIREISNGGPN